MDINFSAFLNVQIIILCLGIGFILKNSVKKLNNDLIPAIVGIIGAIAYCYSTKQVNVETITIGMISGLASTGLYENFKNWIRGLSDSNSDREA